jgi:putative endonuclease
MDHEYWTYIVASLSGTLYIGMTNNIERRRWEHKSETFEGFARDYHCPSAPIGCRLTSLRMTE